jgi:hypothetical protein
MGRGTVPPVLAGIAALVYGATPSVRAAVAESCLLGAAVPAALAARRNLLQDFLNPIRMAVGPFCDKVFRKWSTTIAGLALVALLAAGVSTESADGEVVTATAVAAADMVSISGLSVEGVRP